MEADVHIDSVEEIETRTGKTRYVVRDEHGREYTTFRPGIGREAAKFEGRRAHIEFHEEDRNGFQNVYLDRISEAANRREPGASTDPDEAAWSPEREQARRGVTALAEMRRWPPRVGNTRLPDSEGQLMVTKGLLVRLDVKHGKDAEVEELLRSALPLVQQESATTAWFAVRFGRSEYGIVDFFPDEAGRDAHLAGAVAAALTERSDELFEEPPAIAKLDVLASKLPTAKPAQEITKGLLLTFSPKAGHEDDVAQFLRDARPIVEDEPDTIAWFAIRLADGRHGIFDVFPDNRGRFAHLTGGVARQLAKHALTLLGSFPDTDLTGVLASKLG